MMKYFFIGIKGSGMAGLAILLKDLGNEVVGSDIGDYIYTEDELLEKGISIYNENEFRFDKSYTYIIGNAKRSTLEAGVVYEQDYEYYYYNEFLNKLELGEKIVITGTHGKTTTCSLLAQVLNDSSYVIGDGSGRGKSDSKYFILEGCEYRENFLNYDDIGILVVTNIDFDHPDYYLDIDDTINSFQKIVNKSRTIIINGDFENTQKLKGNHITYGFSKSNDYILEHKNNSLVIRCKSGLVKEYITNIYGKHNLYNLGAALVVSDVIDKRRKIYNFTSLKLPKRRMNEYFIGSNILIDDYAHHPEELSNLIMAVKEKYYGRQIITLFQPHTCSRVKTFLNEYNKILQNSGIYYYFDIFTSAREKYEYIEEFETHKNRLKNNNIDFLLDLNNSVILFVGAGDVSKYLKEYIHKVGVKYGKESRGIKKQNR